MFDRCEIVHLHSHQDKILRKNQLSFHQKLNQLVDDVVNKFARTPLNMHTLFTPLVIYFDNQYIANKYAYHIRRLVFQNKIQRIYPEKEQLEQKDH